MGQKIKYVKYLGSNDMLAITGIRPEHFLQIQNVFCEAHPEYPRFLNLVERLTEFPVPEGEARTLMICPISYRVGSQDDSAPKDYPKCAITIEDFLLQYDTDVFAELEEALSKLEKSHEERVI